MELKLTISGHEIWHSHTTQDTGSPLLVPIPEKKGIDTGGSRFRCKRHEVGGERLDAEKAGKELDLTDLDPGKIEIDLKCWMFKEALLNMAKNVMGFDV